MGALALSNVVSGGQSWRMFTCIWLHGGVVHIFANMFSLILIGIRLEQEFGFGAHHILKQLEKEVLLVLCSSFSV